MQKTILLDNIHPVELLGSNNNNIEIIKKYFPQLVITVKGNSINLTGNEEQINHFETKVNLFIQHIHQNHQLNETDIDYLMSENVKAPETNNNFSDVLVFGPDGLIIKARTVNQKKLVESCNKNDLVFAVGPAGTGKTYTSVAIAVRALKNKEVKHIILTRPAVEAGEHLGFLPGDLKEKLDPYLQPLYDALYDMIPSEKLKYYIENKIIQIAPLAFMRGRTLDNAFVILDEAQNATESQMKMFITRMGKSAKFIITGDITQIDLPQHQPSGLLQAIHLLKNIEGIAFVFLDGRDVIRHDLVKKIITAYEEKN